MENEAVLLQVPALSQSKQALLACPHSYVEQIILGNKGPDSEASYRGTRVHDFLSKYTRHLVADRLIQDLEYWDDAIEGLPPDVREVLDPLRDTFKIDPEVILATEYKITLDAEFAPCAPAEAHYEMTLDLVSILDETHARIDDYKSNFRAFEADTFQVELYSLGVFMIMPQVEEVEFYLQFVRWNRDKKAKFTRADVPRLQEIARQWRALQLRIHENDEIMPSASHGPAANSGGPLEPALPGSHCIYCPLLAAGCPIEANPYQDPVGQLRNVLYFKAALKKSEEAVRANADRIGPITVKDGIGTEYTGAWTLKEKRAFDINCLPTVLAWDKKKGDSLIPKLTISGLSTPLKAKKRAALLDELANFVEIKTESQFRVRKVKEDEDEGDDDEGR